MIRITIALVFAVAAVAQQDSPKDLDLFLLIGQSNMAGRGVVEAQDKQPIARVWMLTEKMEWAPATDPLHFDKPAIAGVGIGRSFARTLLAQRPSASIGLIPAAFGGSALNEWTPDGKHYPNAVARAKQAMKSGKLRGILWHQGEADSKAELAGTYRERFAKFVAMLRQDLGVGDVPVVVGQLGEFFQPDSEGTRKVNEQLALVPFALPKAAFASSAGLKHKGDNVHFDSPSLREFGRRYALAYLSLDAGWAAPPKAATEREIPADRKAFLAAMSISDPEKKIAALEKFRADFPESSIAEEVDENVFSTLVKKLPEQKSRIMKLAHKRYSDAPTAQKGRVANRLASDFLEAGVYLKEAELWSRKSIKSLSETPYMAEQRAISEKRKQPPPSEADLQKRYQEMRAERIAILGRILVKRGNTARGQRSLEEAWAVNQTPPVAVALGELAMNAGDDRKALDYLAVARLSGRAPPAAVSNFETLYRKLNKGSAAGIEEMLDQEYRKRYPNPVHSEAYRPSTKRTQRVVLVEVFTGAGCAPCVAADLAMDVVLERYSRQDVAVVMYHQHIPRPDPMTNPKGQDRRKDYEINGVPTIAIDGKPRTGGGYREHAAEQFKRIDEEIARALETPAAAKLSIKGTLADGIARVHASADSINEAADLKLQVALVEKVLRYTGENGIRFHPMVMRSLVTLPVKASGGSFDATFDLAKIATENRKHLDDYEKTRPESFRFSVKKHEIDPNKVAAVVFLEDPAAHRILQSEWVEFDR